MTKIVIDIKDCSKCPFHETTPYRTADSWERADNWFCSHGGDMKKVAGYVEWNDKTPIPDWCPIKL